MSDWETPQLQNPYAESPLRLIGADTIFVYSNRDAFLTCRSIKLDLYKIIEGKKFMWDGVDYQSKTDAEEKMSKYSGDGFETELIEDDNKYFVFTRRIITEIEVEGEPL